MMRTCLAMSIKQGYALATLAIYCIFSVSCSSDRQVPAGLYNIDSVISTQVGYLVEHEASIQKKAVLNSVETITTGTPGDSISWQKELSIFLELDVVNKPINKGEYEVQQHADSRSNLKVKSFITTEDLPVRFLKVYYWKSLTDLRKIEAQYREANSLYSSTRLLTMEFENIHNKAILSSYRIDGGQKMFLDDSVQYTISATIDLK
jgi:hypothetical protein